MNGLLRIALKLLLNDKGKFATLVIGITFSVFLMMQMTSMFSGILYQSAANIVNVGAKMWVMDPAVETPQNSIPMPDYVLDAVRSIPGVKFAVPLYVGAGLVKLHDGTYQSATIIGLDDAPTRSPGGVTGASSAGRRSSPAIFWIFTRTMPLSWSRMPTMPSWIVQR
jgi:putative ABC transport system permease protein